MNASTVISNISRVQTVSHLTHESEKEVCIHIIFQCETLAKVFQSLLLASYIITGKAESGTILDRVIKAGYNPLNIILSKPKFKRNTTEEDGLVESLRQLLHHENYQKPWSLEHLLANLLTKAF